jgi:hypothetical protein
VSVITSVTEAELELKYINNVGETEGVLVLADDGLLLGDLEGG